MRLLGLPAADLKVIRAANACPTCGKQRWALNAAGGHQRFRAETVTPETHCTCEGGPAHTPPTEPDSPEAA